MPLAMNFQLTEMPFPFQMHWKKAKHNPLPPHLKSLYQAFIINSYPFCKLLAGPFRSEL